MNTNIDTLKIPLKMIVTLKFAEILEGVYAASALATLSRDCTSALLHPDHADALRRTARDAVATLAGAAPDGCLRIAKISDTGCDITVDDSIDPTTAAEVLRAAATSTTVAIIAAAAGLAPLPSIPESLFTPLLPAYSIATITRA